MSTEACSLELGLLPEKKWDWRTFVASYGMLSCLVLLLLLFGVIFPDTLLINSNYHVTELVPLPPLRPERQPKLKVKALPVKLLPAPRVLRAPKLVVPREVRAKKEHPQEIVPPKVAMANFSAVKFMEASGARPVLVHTGAFEGSAVTPTVNAPSAKVQTGGFGDPNGLKPSDKSKANGKLIASAAGSFDMPVGQGQGNGSGGANGIKGTVASANFGSSVATGGSGDGRSGGRGSVGVQSSGFGSQEVAQNTAHVQPLSGPSRSSVEITYKPNPVYTSEARSLQLEGEVLLEVEFAANGQLHVNRVVRGLGHGLDEAAVAAANKMRFKPAMRDGQAIDSTAVVHVVFELAY